MAIIVCRTVVRLLLGNAVLVRKDLISVQDHTMAHTCLVMAMMFVSNLAWSINYC